LFAGYRTGSPEAACLPLADLKALIRIINIIIGVVVGGAVLNAICTAIYIKKKRGGSVAQVAGWTAVGLFFPILSWFFICCCGPNSPSSQNPAVMMVGYNQSSAPPPSDSVTLPPPAFNPLYTSQQQQVQYAPEYYPQPQLPPYHHAAPHAQYPPAQSGSSYQSNAV
jgi:hypothetical protein